MIKYSCIFLLSIYSMNNYAMSEHAEHEALKQIAQAAAQDEDCLRPFNVNFQTADGRTPLMIVHTYEHAAEAVRNLCDAKADVNASTKENITALHIATALAAKMPKGDKCNPIVRALLDYNANPHIAASSHDLALFCDEAYDSEAEDNSSPALPEEMNIKKTPLEIAMASQNIRLQQMLQAAAEKFKPAEEKKG